MDSALPSPALYLIPTPLGDEGPTGALSAPAIDTVRQLRFFAAENLRTARRFLSALRMPVPIDSLEIVLFDKEATDKTALPLVTRVANGESLGMLSEAGAPGIADPGARLVAAAHRIGVTVIPLVGASSLLLALMAAGLNGQSFAFNGYLPIAQRELREAILRMERLATSTGQSQLFIETPYRNDKLLAHLLATLHSSTLLTIASGINTTAQIIRTRATSEWKVNIPTIGKIPTVFIIGVPLPQVL